MVNPENPQRKIIHIDMDCFYAAVEVRENPELRGQPVAVGGRPDQRGVVAACNYEARGFGIHSAMPMSRALRLCPQLRRLPVRMTLYREVSEQIHSIFEHYTPHVEPLSLDEAYLDVTGQPHCQGSASLMAAEIRQRIRQTTGLTASAGVGPNKLIAKIASDWDKPDGLTVVPPGRVDEFIRALPVSKIYGVGRVTAGKMRRLGLHTCADLQALEEIELRVQFGSFGDRLYRLCRGRDERPVSSYRVRKSLSIEDTYPVDLVNLEACLQALEPLYQGLVQRYQRACRKRRLAAEQHGREPQSMTPKTLVLKMRFDDFVTTTAQQGGDRLALQPYRQLCERAYRRGMRPVRLLGLGIVFKVNS